MVSYEHIRAALELIYFISSIVIAVVAVFGVRQLHLLKYDIRSRNKRAALETSVFYVEKYYTVVVPANAEWFEELKKSGAPDYGGSITHLPPIEQEIVLERLGVGELYRYLNAIEMVATGLNSGLCDEDYAFQTISMTFCNTVADVWDIITALRISDKDEPNSVTHYSNTVELFERWRARIMHTDLGGVRPNPRFFRQPLPPPGLSREWPIYGKIGGVSLRS